MKISKLLAVGLAGALALSACSSNDSATTTTPGSNSGDKGGSGGGSQESATLRIWLNGKDTPDALVDYAKAEFKKKHPNVTVELERQQWDGLVNKLTTSLSGDDTPDIVEMGNTQAQAFQSAGALTDLTESKSQLGGDDLVESTVESGTYEGKLYAVPYYVGTRVVVYRKDLLQAANLQVPKTLDEFIETGIKLKQANSASKPNFSGIYLPGKNWQATLSFIWQYGGDIAAKDGDKWEGTLSSDNSVKGLKQVQKIMTQANGAPADGTDANDDKDWCNGVIAMEMAPGWKVGQVVKACPEIGNQLGAFALPGEKAGTTAPAFLGGSNLGVAAKSRNQQLAVEFLSVLMSKEYQTKLGENGLIPVRKSVLDSVGGDEATKAQALSAKNAKFVPNSKNWAGVEGADTLKDMGTGIAQGKDVKAEAQKADEAIATALNA